MSEILRNSHEWFQHQQQQQHHFFNTGQMVYPSSPTSTLSHDAVTVSTQGTASFVAADKSVTTPKGSCVGKVIRRRSRASKKTPVTLLNADVKDFRALVQRFTGCRTTEISFTGSKGPVNLNFAASHDYHPFLPTANSPSSGIVFNDSNNNNNNNNSYLQQQWPESGHGLHNFNWRSKAEDRYNENRGILVRSTGDRDQEHHHDMLAMNYEMQTADQFQSLDDILKLDDISGTSLHDLIGDIIT